MSLSIHIDAIDYDFRIIGGRLQRVTGADAVAQRLRVRLHAYLGEWFLDRRFGLPWYDGEMLGASNSRLISPLIRREILKDPEVEAVLSFAVSQIGRQLSIQATVRTTRGNSLSLSEVFNG